MPVTDRRESAVYVTIEDASYAAPALEVGRVGYVCILCDRGPHNRIVTITSKTEFHKLFGKPDYRRSSLSHYLADTFLDYSSKLLVCRVMPQEVTGSGAVAGATWANTSIKKNTTFTAIPTYTYEFTNDSETVTCSDIDARDTAIDIGDWVYGQGGTISDAAQVVAKNDSPTVFELTLDRSYSGPSTGGLDTAYKGMPYESSILTNIRDDNWSGEFDPTDDEVVYYFYAIGAGSYYNNVTVRGVRNIQMDKTYTDENGNILFNYIFMDIAVYRTNEDGTETLLEGPWTVSLVKRTPTNVTVRDLSSGRVMFIEDVINESSQFVRCVASAGVDDLSAAGQAGEDARLQTLLLLSGSDPYQVDPVTGLEVAISNYAYGGLILENGYDGQSDSNGPVEMYGANGNLQNGDDLWGLVAQSYFGNLTSIDGTVEQMKEVTYPWYQPDYVITGGFPANVQVEGYRLAEYREDCIHLADTGDQVSYQADLALRRGSGDYAGWNRWTSALYVQYRKMSDNYTGEKIWMTPVYHALQRHLFCDGAYFVAEPVANIEKGAIVDPIELRYKANHTERGDLQDHELNFVIVEPQGTYILTQLTTWKRLSILKRLHVAKFVAYIRKVIPTLLKDLLQRKGTAFWVGQASVRVNEFLGKFFEGPVERYSILKSFNVNVEFDDVRSEINVYIDITPIRAIERINVFITVY